MSFKKDLINTFKPTKLKTIITGIFFIMFIISFLIFPPLIENYADANLRITTELNKIKQINEQIEIQSNPEIVSNLEKQRENIATEMLLNSTKARNQGTLLTYIHYPYIVLKLFKLNIFPMPCEMSLIFNYEYALKEPKCTYQIISKDKAEALTSDALEKKSEGSLIFLGSDNLPKVKTGNYFYQLLNYIFSTIIVYITLSIIFIFRKNKKEIIN